MNYDELTKNELITRIKELEGIIKILQKEVNIKELCNMPWVGNLGHWQWMPQSNRVIFNDKKITTLGYAREEFPENIGYEFFTDRLHKDDFEPVMNNMRQHLMGITQAYEVEYRIKAKNGKYLWYYDRGKVIERDEEGKALIVSGIVFDITQKKALEEELKITNEKLHEQATKDELTGCYNRRYGLECLNSEMERSNRTNAPLTIIMIDIDDFKKVNDNYGHDIGDEVLKEFVEVMESRKRQIDIFSRWGGEEFILLALDTNIDKAVAFVNEIRISLEKHNFKTIGRLTASFGVVQFERNETITSILTRVDQVMYCAKRNGKNCVMSRYN